MSGTTKAMRKFFILVFIFLLALPVSASDTVYNDISSSISDELEIFKSSLPNEVLDFFPKEIWNGDFSSLLGGEYNEGTMLDYVIDYLFLGLKSTINSFASIIIVILIASIFKMLQESMNSDSLKEAFSITSALCICFTVASICINIAKMTSQYMSTLCGIMKSFLPIMSVLYIMNGNISSGAVASSSLLLFIALVEQFLLSFMLPIVEFSICFSIIRVFNSHLSFDGISKTLKNTFTSVTGFIMSIFMFVLSTKNILAQGADSISMKTAKFAISSFIPIVGGAVGESLKTVSTSLSFIKGSLGVIAIIVIVVSLLPAIISLLLNKLSFSILSGIGKCLGLNSETGITDEGSSICGFLLALAACTGVMFIFALTVFIKASSGGASLWEDI